MKKRLISILMVGLFAISVVGCGSGTQTKTTEKTTQEKKDTENDTKETSVETEADNTEAAGAAKDKKLKIAYIENFAAHEFYENICAGAKNEAEKLGVELMIADGNGDINKQISLGENYLVQDIDALIVTPADATGIAPLIEKAVAAGVPVITESVKAEKQTTYVGIDDFEGGKLVGVFAGNYVKEHNLDVKKCLLVGLPALEACVNRTEGFKEGMLSIIPTAEFVEVDGQGAKDKAMEVATNALTANPDINLIMGINDDSTLGGIQAYTAQGNDVKDLVAFGFGVEGVAAKNELSNLDSPYMGGLGMFPENIGKILVEKAVAAANKEEMPDTVKVPFDVLNKDNINEYYTQSGDQWFINWNALDNLK